MVLCTSSPGRRLLAGLALAVLGACGDDDGGSAGLDDFLPPIPEPTGEAASVFAGEVTSQGQVPGGAAATGMPGDFFLKNASASFIIQSPTRVIGVISAGGNLIDAVGLDPDGQPLTDDQFGELSMIYLVGRTCDHQTVEVVQDGAGGGVAAIVARGVATHNDFINLKGTGLLPLNADLDPDVPDSVECATTYVLSPDSPTLEVYWTLFNGGERDVEGPFAALSDSGGSIETFAPGRGFERLGVEDIIAAEAAPIDYDVFQGPDVAYGLLPIHAEAGVANSAYLIAGISIILFGTETFLGALRPEGYYLDLPIAGGVTHRLGFTVGRDAADADLAYRGLTGEATAVIAGTVALDDGSPAAGARVGVFVDVDGDGEVGPDDFVQSYLDTDAAGTFAGEIVQGSYLVRADLFERARSAATAVDLTADTTGLAIELPAPVVYDLLVADAETGDPVPSKLTVLGDNPAAPDPRLHSRYDAIAGVTTMRFLQHGTSVDLGDGADAALALPPGGTYRVYATRGPEWSFATADLTPVAGEQPAPLELELRRVVDTTGYLASEYHVHSIGSPDSPVSWDDRVVSAAVEGVELWASTEHEYVAELQPVVEALGLGAWTRALTGEEVSPFVYGHFIGFPLERDLDSPSRGAVDWAAGAGGFAMLPGEIMAALVAQGAEVVQVNHPRSTPSTSSDFMQYFDRAVLTFDYAARTISGDPAAQSLSNEALRLEPGAALFALDFNALEVWNGLETGDSDADGVRDVVSLDQVMRDWFNFLSFGVPMTPMGNSDTHTVIRDPMGLPRTMVRVPDDGAAALADGSVVESVYDTLAGRGAAPRDVVVTNGPMLRVTEVGGSDSVIGAVVDGAGGVALRVTVQAATWAPFDTIEIFANATPEVGTDDTVLQPLVCFTTRAPDELAATDPCALAPLGALPLTVTTANLGAGYQRLEATVDVALTAAEIAAATREGATGQDAWVVARARGQRAVFPFFLGNLPAGALLGTLVTGSAAAIDAALIGIGLPASGFTAPVFVDFDGGGYRAPFAPE